MANVSFRANIGKVRGLAFNNDGKARFSFSAAEGHRKKGQDGQWADSGTTWYNVTVFGKPAEDLADVIAEGRKQSVVVSGRMETREYEANGETRTSLDVVADNVGIVHRAPQSQQPASQPAQSQQQWGGQQDAWGGGQQGFDAPSNGPAPF